MVLKETAPPLSTPQATTLHSVREREENDITTNSHLLRRKNSDSALCHPRPLPHLLMDPIEGPQKYTKRSGRRREIGILTAARARKEKYRGNLARTSPCPDTIQRWRVLIQGLMASLGA